MGKNFRETLNEQLKDPAFRAEWEALEPERRIPFVITSDPFYSESNVMELKRRYDAIKAGTAKLEEHELIEDDSK